MDADRPEERVVGCQRRGHAADDPVADQQHRRIDVPGVLVEGVASRDLQVALLRVVVLAQVFVGVGGGRLAGVRTVLVHQHAGEEARLARLVLAERARVRSDDRRIGRQLVEVDHLVEMGDERVRQDDDRAPRLLGRVEGLDRDLERLLHAVGVERQGRVIAGAAVAHLHDVALAGHGRHAGGGANALHVDEDARHADLLGVAHGFLHQAEARAAGGGERLGAGQRGADDGIGAGDLVLRLQEAELGCSAAQPEAMFRISVEG